MGKCGLLTSRSVMRGDQWLTKLLHSLNCGAFDHVSHVPQLRECNWRVEASPPSRLNGRIFLYICIIGCRRVLHTP